jgi:beta-lactamase superfamily II metal-dependent hydrolase
MTTSALMNPAQTAQATAYEIDFLPVGDGKDSGDAIAMRFIRPDTGGWAVVIIDAGFENDGEALVAHVKQYYGTSVVDLAILTHPDGDHIGGMGKVLRGLTVKKLWLHDIGSRGGRSLPAAKAVRDLITRAESEGTKVFEAWAGAQAFGGALTVLGPDRGYYEQLVNEQVEGPGKAAIVGKALREAAAGLFDRIADGLHLEVPFVEKDVSPRNNSSMITLLNLDGNQLLFTGDAGVPALNRAWDKAEALGLAAPPSFVQIPHHGSRRNGSSAWLDRLLGPTGQVAVRTAFVSVVAESDKHPSGKIVNAHARRGCRVVATAGSTKYHFHGMSMRSGWSPAEPLPPMVEEDDD